jgi:hypothetical protein
MVHAHREKSRKESDVTLTFLAMIVVSSAILLELILVLPDRDTLMLNPRAPLYPGTSGATAAGFKPKDPGESVEAASAGTGIGG